MSPSDNSFTDNMSAVSRQYATAAGLSTDGDGKVPHIDQANVEPQEGETTPETEAAVANPDVDAPAVVVEGEGQDPDELSDEELEAATAPDGEQE